MADAGVELRWRESRESADAPARDGVVVHQVSLRSDEAALAAARELLSPDERARADRFRFDRDRRRFSIARAALRTLLARRLGRAPQALGFVAGTHGKPALDDGALHFNVSHSDEVALIGICASRPIGIDVERVRAPSDLRALVARVFTEREQSELLALPDAEQLAAFFTGWTRKEAILKASGAGLSRPLSSIEVSLDRTNLQLDPPTGFTLCALPPIEGFAAALAIEGAALPIEATIFEAAPEKSR